MTLEQAKLKALELGNLVGTKFSNGSKITAILAAPTNRPVVSFISDVLNYYLQDMGKRLEKEDYSYDVLLLIETDTCTIDWKWAREQYPERFKIDS